MKKYFVNILKFIVLTIVVYIFGIVVWGVIPHSYLGSNFLYRQGSYGHLNTRIKEIPAYGEVDILFVGSSRVYRGFDPRFFEKHGVKIFVLGSSSQTPLQSYVLLKRYIDQLNPKLVVLDLLPSSLAIKGVEPTLDLFSNDKIDELSIEIALKQNDLMVYNTLVYASIMQVIGKHSKFKERIYKPEENDTYIKGGYVQKDLLYKSITTCDEPQSYNWSKPLDLQLFYFNKMVKILNKKNKKTLIVNMPLAHYDCFSNNMILVKHLPNAITYFDFNKLVNFNDSKDFYDDFHLNTVGVHKLGDFVLNSPEFLSSIKN